MFPRIRPQAGTAMRPCLILTKSYNSSVRIWRNTEKSGLTGSRSQRKKDLGDKPRHSPDDMLLILEREEGKEREILIGCLPYAP